MASYATKIGETALLIEAPASGAFAKSELEITPDKSKAIVNCIDVIKHVARHMVKEIGPITRGGLAADIAFAVRADGNGLVMVSQDATEGQFQVTLKFVPRRPSGPRPGNKPA